MYVFYSEGSSSYQNLLPFKRISNIWRINALANLYVLLVRVSLLVVTLNIASKIILDLELYCFVLTTEGHSNDLFRLNDILHVLGVHGYFIP